MLLAVVHSTAWFIACRVVAQRFDAWADLQRANGVHVVSGPTARTGWPVAAGVSIDGIVVGETAARWTAERLDVIWRPWSPNRIHIQPSGRQEIVAGAMRISGRAGAIDVSLLLPQGTDPVFVASDIVAELPEAMGGGTLAASAIEAELRSGSGRDRSDSALLLHATVKGAHLPPSAVRLLGAEIADATVDMDVSGPVPESGFVTEQAEAWRDGGGTARLTRAHLQWGKVIIDATGLVALDRALQPVADLGIRLMGQNEALDAMVAQGVLTARTAGVARAVLAMFARAQPGPDGAPAPIPVTLRDGTVTLGGIPVARVPAIAWP